MEFCAGGSVEDMLKLSKKALTEAEIAEILRLVLEVVHFGSLSFVECLLSVQKGFGILSLRQQNSSRCEGC